MVNDGKYLQERKYMSLEAISDKIIERSPPEIRTILWHAAPTVNSIFDISIAAEKIVPLVYGRNGFIEELKSANQLKVQQENNPNQQEKAIVTYKTSGKANNCIIHGTGSHSSIEYKIIIMARKNFLEKRKVSRSMEKLKQN